MNVALKRVEDPGDEVVRARIEGKPITLKALAARHNRSYTALRITASKGKWTQRAVAAVAARNLAAAGDGGRRLQVVALDRLAALIPGEVPVKLAAEILKVGIDSERSALGLAATTSICDGENRGDGLREAVHVALAIMARHTRPACGVDMGAPVAEDARN